VTISLGPASPPASCGLPGHRAAFAALRRAAGNDALLGLAPGGVYRAAEVTLHAGELLPHRFTLARTADEVWLTLDPTPAAAGGV